MPKYYYYKVGDDEIPHSAFTVEGALVHVQKSTSTEFSSARLRLFDPSALGDLRQHIARIEYDSVQAIPTIVIDYDEVVKSIVSLAEKPKKTRGHRFSIYWAPATFSDWKSTGFNAEFTWAPTAEPPRNIPKSDFENQLAWLTPLVPAIEEVLNNKLYLNESEKGEIGSGTALIYEEDWDWDSAHERDFDVVPAGETPAGRPLQFRGFLDIVDDSDTGELIGDSHIGGAAQRESDEESAHQRDGTIPPSEGPSPLNPRKRGDREQSEQSSADGHEQDHAETRKRQRTNATQSSRLDLPGTLRESSPRTSPAETRKTSMQTLPMTVSDADSSARADLSISTEGNGSGRSGMKRDAPEVTDTIELPANEQSDRPSKPGTDYRSDGEKGTITNGSLTRMITGM
ncbi:hypothetical protein HK104_010658 [Borealophlyctis nickersoniae]|nr:hypothetical protein HK104_010658 [Borealophlyctis nickersoniae]